MKRELYLPEEYHGNREARRRKLRKWLCVLFAVIIGLCLTGSIVRARQVQQKMEKTQQKLAGEVFRFHVLANSDSEEDQALKRKVRDAVLNYMKKEFPESENVAETKMWVEGHLPEIRQAAEAMIAAEGEAYPVTAEVARCNFPDKTYGDVTFPAGEYDALRILIGKAKGHNWWCVLYPNLCFMDSVHAVVPDEGKEKLKKVLTDEEYELVTNRVDFKVKWFFFGS